MLVTDRYGFNTDLVRAGGPLRPFSPFLLCVGLGRRGIIPDPELLAPCGRRNAPSRMGGRSPAIHGCGHDPFPPADFLIPNSELLIPNS